MRLFQDRLVEDLLALADLQPFLQLFAGEADVDICDLLVIHHHAALLHEPPPLALRRDEAAGQHQVEHGDLPIGQLSFRELGRRRVGVVRAARGPR